MISDVKTYQGLPRIVEAIKPDYVIIAGDILYDGKGHRYIDENGEVITGNTHTDKRLLELHTDAFRDFLSKSLDEGVKQILLLYGDHDISEDVDFNKLISAWGLDSNRIIDAPYPTDIYLDGTSLFVIPYIESYDELRDVLRENKDLLETVDIIVTHLELSKLRILARRIQIFRGLSYSTRRRP